MKRIEYYKEPVALHNLYPGLEEAAIIVTGEVEKFFEKLSITEPLHLILEPGQVTRYEFISVPLEDGSIVISEPQHNLCWQVYGVAHPVDFNASRYIQTHRILADIANELIGADIEHYYNWEAGMTWTGRYPGI